MKAWVVLCSHTGMYYFNHILCSDVQLNEARLFRTKQEAKDKMRKYRFPLDVYEPVKVEIRIAPVMGLRTMIARQGLKNQKKGGKY